MVQEEYVSFEVAKLLKEKGFNEPCHYFYKFDSRDVYYGSELTNSQIGNKFYNTPTQQMAMRWLREEKNILLYLYPIIVLPVKDNYTFYWRWDGKKKIHCAPHIGNKHDYESYEEAVEAAIKYCLENLI